MHGQKLSGNCSRISESTWRLATARERFECQIMVNFNQFQLLVGGYPSQPQERWLLIWKHSSVILSAGISSETLETRRQGIDIYKVLKEKKSSTKNLYATKLFFRIEGETKIFSDNSWGNLLQLVLLWNRCQWESFQGDMKGDQTVNQSCIKKHRYLAKVNTQEVIRTNIIVPLVGNSVFYFLNHLRD